MVSYRQPSPGLSIAARVFGLALVLGILAGIPDALHAQHPGGPAPLDSDLVTSASSDQRELSTSYVAVSLANALLGGVAAGANLHAVSRNTHSPGATTLGISAGSASMALGLLGIVRGGDRRAIGAANLAVGAASTWVAYRAATQEREVQFGPWIEWQEDPATKAASRSVATGVRFTYRF